MILWLLFYLTSSETGFYTMESLGFNANGSFTLNGIIKIPYYTYVDKITQRYPIDRSLDGMEIELPIGSEFLKVVIEDKEYLYFTMWAEHDPQIPRELIVNYTKEFNKLDREYQMLENDQTISKDAKKIKESELREKRDILIGRLANDRLRLGIFGTASDPDPSAFLPGYTTWRGPESYYYRMVDKLTILFGAPKLGQQDQDSIGLLLSRRDNPELALNVGLLMGANNFVFYEGSELVISYNIDNVKTYSEFVIPTVIDISRMSSPQVKIPFPGGRRTPFEGKIILEDINFTLDNAELAPYIKMRIDRYQDPVKGTDFICVVDIDIKPFDNIYGFIWNYLICNTEDKQGLLESLKSNFDLSKINYIRMLPVLLRKDYPFDEEILNNDEILYAIAFFDFNHDLKLSWEELYKIFNSIKWRNGNNGIISDDVYRSPFVAVLQTSTVSAETASKLKFQILYYLATGKDLEKLYNALDKDVVEKYYLPLFRDTIKDKSRMDIADRFYKLNQMIIDSANSGELVLADAVIKELKEGVLE